MPSLLRARIAEALVVVVLLACHGWLAISSSREKSLTFDEVAHIGAGIVYRQASDYRMNAESGVLPQLWAALPAGSNRVALPEASAPARRQANVWDVGRDILFGRDNDTKNLVHRARSMIVLSSICLGLVVYLGSRSLFGTRGALLSLVLYASSPTMLAHARMVTADLFTALFFLLASWAIWRLLHRVTAGRLVVAVAATSGLVLSKFSGLLIVPIALILIAVRFARALVRKQGLVATLGRHRFHLRTASVLLVLVVVVLGVWATIWAAYDLRYAADPQTPDGAADGSVFLHSWQSLLADRGLPAQVIGTARRYELLPEAYLWGLAYTLDTTAERDAFLAGRTSTSGWWWFFPYALLIKTPLALFVLLALAGGAWATRAGPRWRPGSALYRTAPLWALMLVYWAAAMSSHINIGHRHVLVSYPVLFLLAGGAAGWLTPPWPRRQVLASALVLLSATAFVVESWAIRPHYLAYFNQLVGGPENGFRHLVDSSLDWGQDLPALRAAIEGQRATPIYVSYFGSAVPAHYGLDRPGVRWLYSFFSVRSPAEPPGPLSGGIYCVSATLLQSVHVGALGPWNARRESAYRELHSLIARFAVLSQTAEGRSALEREKSPPEWILTFADYERLRSARLYRYLLKRQPDARAGYSINIYRLSDSEVEEAVLGAPVME